jgi:hypothetical protein
MIAPPWRTGWALQEIPGQAVQLHQRNPDWNRPITRPFDPSMVALSPHLAHHPVFGLVYAWSGFAVMWAFWVSFVFFANRAVCSVPGRCKPLITGDGCKSRGPRSCSTYVLAALFALQHCMMARPWLKDRVTRMPGPFARCTYVHMANTALFLLIIFWQPIPVDVWTTHEAVAQAARWALFAAGWAILFLGAWSFGTRDLLGIQQMQAWIYGRGLPAPRLKTGRHLARRVGHPAPECRTSPVG